MTHKLCLKTPVFENLVILYLIKYKLFFEKNDSLRSVNITFELLKGVNIAVLRIRLQTFQKVVSVKNVCCWCNECQVGTHCDIHEANIFEIWKY